MTLNWDQAGGRSKYFGHSEASANKNAALYGEAQRNSSTIQSLHCTPANLGVTSSSCAVGDIRGPFRYGSYQSVTPKHHRYAKR